MNYARVASDIDTLLRDRDSLPSELASGQMWDGVSYCVAGLIAKLLIGVDAAESGNSEQRDVWTVLKERYDAVDGPEFFDLTISWDSILYRCNHQTIPALLYIQTRLQEIIRP